MTETKIDKEALKRLKEALPRGAITRLSKVTGKSRQAVNDVLNGLYTNNVIIEEAIKEALEYKEQIKKQSHLIQKVA